MSRGDAPRSDTTLPPMTDRHARMQHRALPGPRSALWYYPFLAGGYLRVARNALVIQLARYIPLFRLKNWLYRRLGMQVAPHATVGLMVMFDIFFPEAISLGEDCVIGYNTTILCHEVTRQSWLQGPVVIGRDVTIGANCTILPGVVIGDGATISAMSLVNRDVPPGAFVGGVPIRPLQPRGV
ncbi:MAG: acyltransferase [Oscillochloridaceae bacterium umkhey_bin13]